MMLYLVVCVVMVAVIAGIIIAWRGYSSEDSKAVPISDINEFRNLRKNDTVVPFESKFSSTPFQSPTPKPSLTDHLLKENLNTKPVAQTPPASSLSSLFKNNPAEKVEAPISLKSDVLNPSAPPMPAAVPIQPAKDSEEVIRLRQEVSDLKNMLADEAKKSQEQYFRYTKDKEELTAKLTVEAEQKNAQSGLAEENAKLQEKLKELEVLQKNLQTVTQENYALSQQIQSDKSKTIEADEKLRLLTEQVSALEKERLQLEQGTIRRDQEFQVYRLEAEAKQKHFEEIRASMDGVKQKLDEAEALNRALQEKLDAVSNAREIQLSQNEYTFEQQQQEKERLIFQLKVSELKVSELQKTIDVLRQNFELRAKVESDQRVHPAKEATEQKLEWAIFNLEELKREKEKLNQVNAELELRLSKIREHNAQLSKKENMLHYELSKSRAQAMGLEKICISLKEQLDLMTKSSGVL